MKQQPNIQITYLDHTAQIDVEDLNNLVESVKATLEGRAPKGIVKIVKDRLEPLVAIQTAVEAWKPSNDWPIQHLFLTPPESWTTVSELPFIETPLTRNLIENGQLKTVPVLGILRESKNTTSMLSEEMCWSKPIDPYAEVVSFSIVAVILRRKGNNPSDPLMYVTLSAGMNWVSDTMILDNRQVPSLAFSNIRDDIAIRLAGEIDLYRGYLGLTVILDPDVFADFEYYGFVPEISVKSPPVE